MARVASGRSRAFLFVAVLLPLWSSYLIRVYVWRLILEPGRRPQLGAAQGRPAGRHLAYTNWAIWIVFSYVWLAVHDPAGLRRRSSGSPTRYIEASRDLGAQGSRRSRRGPAARAAGRRSPARSSRSRSRSATTSRRLLGGRASSQFIGNVVYQSVGVANNVPFAAAFATVPLVVMAVYLLHRAPARSLRGDVMESRGTRGPRRCGRRSSCSSSGCRSR